MIKFNLLMLYDKILKLLTFKIFLLFGKLLHFATSSCIKMLPKRRFIRPQTKAVHNQNSLQILIL